jgi:hypothetical protein
MWVESRVHVGNDSIRVQVQHLDNDERERTAATLAWLTLEAMRSGADSECGPWHELVNGLLGQHVAFEVPDDRLAEATTEWWSEVVGRALTQFVRENDLAASINRHVPILQGAAAGSGFQS